MSVESPTLVVGVLQRELICPKCHAEYEDNGKDYPGGLKCPNCREIGYNIVGVITPRFTKRKITQEEWDEVTAENKRLKALIEDKEKQNG